jgi:predicted acylesterase/phospholipase RssA
LSRFGRHFVKTREIKAFERRLVRLVVDQPGALHRGHEALYRYAASMAQMHLLRAPGGDDLPVAEEVDALRRWMLESIVGLVPSARDAHIQHLRELATPLALRVDSAREAILARHEGQVGPEDLDDELRRKRLVLVLGGGGGAGLVHLGAFSLFDELDATPELIVGSSMGSILGTLRALHRDYDPVTTTLAVPRDIDYDTVFRPFSGATRFGFPGAFHMNLLRIAREIFQHIIGRSNLLFSDLAIPLEVVTCGIRRGFQFDESEFTPNRETSFSPWALRRKLKLFFQAVRRISKNPRFLTQVVFGRDVLTRDFPVAEAVGFSCAVPGLFHFDIFHDDPQTVGPLEQIFEEHGLLRLCDGGVVNNVPSRVAWESVQEGTCGTRNTCIVAMDAFAPVSRPGNLIWIPIQQIARPPVLANKPYSDYHKTFHAPPSPLQIIVNSYSKLKQIITDARAELDEDVPYLERSLEELPPYGSWPTD